MPSPSLAYLLPDPEHSPLARSLLVVGYLLAALCWLRASQKARLASAGSIARSWLLGATFLVLLAINKQFDLRLCFEQGFRALAKATGSYDHREPLQFVLAVILPSVVAVCIGVLLATKARVFVRCHPLALIGWLLLLCYLALRQTQEWKPMLPWLKLLRYYDWRLALEAAGIIFVAAAALVVHRTSSDTLPRQHSRNFRVI